MSIKVRQVMGRVAIAVREETAFADIVAVMRRYGVGAVAVVDADRRPVGVVSEDDLLLRETGAERRGVAVFGGAVSRLERHKAVGRTAAELMTAPAVTVTPGTPVRTAACLMHEKRIKQLPVVDALSGRITGTVHQADLLRVFARPAAELLAEIATVIRAETGLDPDAFSFDVHEGVVSLGGEVVRHHQIRALVAAIRRVEGVVGVECRLTCACRSDVGSC
ncbi:hypothetical protein Misp01_21400 [Microtetraspora sp. NBRC 13810]|uniref:CBS domain-containing protein n=1 Tax=Microtetraspora sp. NBRC 13810 TaxID=3030990 RepID=UPI0024A021EF|nr:CBS domain-containing protein [Microtetraspora sp. NBRC 13810]GLW07010.1 hypothetical protein Misp01_21400 [Microtetraspora sp. NBRC 13810]